LTLPSSAIGSQRRAHKIPDEVFSQPAGTDAPLDMLSDGLLEMVDTDEALQRHGDEVWAGKAEKLTDGQKRTMRAVAGRQKRRRRSGRGN
ncbi:MAG: hypothetical protein GY772_21285, partial [bacterium]|nr:hypothetical protein [bacterium]